tara:strand:+ start:124 stop:273 length:150 start_codon:yes stop_codon:yes gene_type:complete
MNECQCMSWEEVPDEELWEDGELSEEEVHTKIFVKVRNQGIWKLIRRIQ